MTTANPSITSDTPSPHPIINAHIRIAPPTSNLSSLHQFYCTGLGFSVLYSFTNHAGFDGLMLGHRGATYHLEFTYQHKHKNEEIAAPVQAALQGQEKKHEREEGQVPSVLSNRPRQHIPTEENLLVFYLPNEREWQAAVQKMRDAGLESVRAGNPYWEEKGRTFEDPDGYRIVLQNAKGGWD